MSGLEPPAAPPPPPPSTPPPPTPPPPPVGPSRSRRLPWIVGGTVVLVLVVVIVLALVLGGSKAAADARSVQDVADAAVDAAEDLDVEQGIDLLCEAPSSSERDDLEELIADGRAAAGTDDPDVDYDVVDVTGDDEGTFTVKISSDEEGLEGRGAVFTVVVKTDGDRSCIDALATQVQPDDE